MKTQNNRLVKAIALNAIAITLFYAQSCTKQSDEVRIPALTTKAITDLSFNSAVTGGTITSEGGAKVSVRGVCYAVQPHPTLTDSVKTAPLATNEFLSQLSNLSPNTTYYVRAFATNTAGTAYGTEISFTTTDGLASVTTANATSINEISATLGGNITSDGGSEVTDYGLVFGSDANPEYDPNNANNHISLGNGSGSFSLPMPGFKPGNTYHVRAYALNANGRAYGNDISFTTTSVVVSNGLVAFYKFNNSGTDFSGNNNPISNDNLLFGTDRNSNTNSSIYLDGSTSKPGTYLDFGNSASGSISMWFYSQNDAYNILTLDNPMFRVFDNGSVGFGVCNPCGAVSHASANGAWHHIVGTYDGTTIQLYYDNQLAGTYNNPGGPSFQVHALVIGYSLSGGYWQGYIDNLRLYNRVITASEVTQLYQE